MTTLRCLQPARPAATLPVPKALPLACRQVNSQALVPQRLASEKRRCGASGDLGSGRRLMPAPAQPCSRPTHVCRAGNQDISQEARMREEVISPFRTVRMFLYVGFIGSAGVGSLVAGVRLLGALAGAPGDGMAKGLDESLLDFGIDIAALAVFAFLYSIDAKAKDAQLVKLAREEALSQLRVELASGRIVKMAQLRGACRVVIVAGPLSHIQRAMALAAPLKDELLERGVTVVPFVTEEDVAYSAPAPAASAQKGSASADYKAFLSVIGKEAAAAAAAAAAQAPAAEGASKEEGEMMTPRERREKQDLVARWMARPLYTNEWEGWLKDQLKAANVDNKSPVYLSLRLDGRVRGSGVGFPRWQVIAAQLPPMKGMWQGPFDGMDGRVL